MAWLRRMYAHPLFVVVGILGAVLARFAPDSDVPAPLPVLAAPLAVLAAALAVLAAPWNHGRLRLYAGAYE